MQPAAQTKAYSVLIIVLFMFDLILTGVSSSLGIPQHTLSFHVGLVSCDCTIPTVQHTVR